MEKESSPMLIFPENGNRPLLVISYLSLMNSKTVGTLPIARETNAGHMHYIQYVQVICSQDQHNYFEYLLISYLIYEACYS